MWHIVDGIYQVIEDDPRPGPQRKMEPDIQDDEFPMCCGGRVFSNFGYTDTSNGDNDEFKLPAMKRDLRRLLRQYRNRAFCSIALNQDQRKVYGRMLKDLGFQMVGSGYNQPHESTVYLYTKFNRKKKRK